MIVDEQLQPTQDLNVRSTVPLIAPRLLREETQVSLSANRTVVESRETIKKILSGEDPRMFAVVGPCSIHDPKGALEYAARLRNLAERVQDRLVLVMRVYFEKPRTTLGWKGLINDPNLDGTFDIAAGLRLARRILLVINDMGLPAATEMLEPITPQYIADLITLASIGSGRRNRRRIAKWQAGYRCRSDTKTGPMAACKWRSTPCSPLAVRTVSWGSTGKETRASSTPRGICAAI